MDRSMTDLTLRSPAFEDGSRIPETYGHAGENVNPPLEMQGVPSETASLVLIVDNPDRGSSSKETWIHWIVWDVPPSLREIPEGWNPDRATEGQNGFGNHGYGGPNPTGQRQTCRFRLYALETMLGLPPATEKDELVDEVVGHVLDNATLEGTYVP